MNCGNLSNKLGRYLDGELAPSSESAVRDHLDSCPACRADAEHQRCLAAFLTSSPIEPAPANLTRSILFEARQRISARQGSSFDILVDMVGWFRSAGRPLRWAAASTITFGILIGVMMGRHMASPGEQIQAANQSSLVEIYSLDFLSESPSGTLSDRYLAMVDGTSRGEE